MIVIVAYQIPKHHQVQVQIQVPVPVPALVQAPVQAQVHQNVLDYVILEDAEVKGL